MNDCQTRSAKGFLQVSPGSIRGQANLVIEVVNQLKLNDTNCLVVTVGPLNPFLLVKGYGIKLTALAQSGGFCSVPLTKFQRPCNLKYACIFLDQTWKFEASSFGMCNSMDCLEDIFSRGGKNVVSIMHDFPWTRKKRGPIAVSNGVLPPIFSCNIGKN